MADIFISFRTDDTSRVKLIREAFLARGLSVFWSNDIPKGAPNYQAIIEQELLDASVVAVAWTRHGNGWTQERVRSFRHHYDIAIYRDGERTERGEIALDAAAEIIGVCKMTALRMIRRADIKERQICTGAPWVIRAEDVAAFAARSDR